MQNQIAGGLLGAFAQPQQQDQSGGLLGGFGGGPPAPQQPGGGGLRMAQQLSQNPTPQMAQQIIAQLHQMGNPEAARFEQMIGQVMNNPQALKHLADTIAQKLGGQSA
jgi:hypothetical protein